MLAGDLVFYRNDGIAGVAHIENGKIEQTDSRNDFTTHWSKIVPVGNQLVFYRNDGVAAVAHIENGKVDHWQVTLKIGFTLES